MLSLKPFFQEDVPYSLLVKTMFHQHFYHFGFPGVAIFCTIFINLIIDGIILKFLHCIKPCLCQSLPILSHVVNLGNVFKTEQLCILSLSYINHGIFEHFIKSWYFRTFYAVTLVGFSMEHSGIVLSGHIADIRTTIK